jgi:hypothetical protein
MFRVKEKMKIGSLNIDLGLSSLDGFSDGF